jgi:hypothetical protein
VFPVIPAPFDKNPESVLTKLENGKKAKPLAMGEISLTLHASNNGPERTGLSEKTNIPVQNTAQHNLKETIRVVPLNRTKVCQIKCLVTYRWEPSQLPHQCARLAATITASTYACNASATVEQGSAHGIIKLELLMHIL